MKNTAIEKLSYTEVTKNISQAEYNQTQEEYILSKSPDKYMISLPVKVLMFEGAKDSSPFTYYFYMENDEDLYLMQRKRNGSVVDKTKIPLTKEQGQKILDGDYQFLLDSDEPLLNSLYFQFTVNQLHPLYRKECTRKIFHQNRWHKSRSGRRSRPGSAHIPGRRNHPGRHNIRLDHKDYGSERCHSDIRRSSPAASPS